jgi:hypothetical protein
MEGLLQDRACRSQLELLISQQRYEEIMALLSDAIAQNPLDRDARLVRFWSCASCFAIQSLDNYQEDLPRLSKRSIYEGWQGRAELACVPFAVLAQVLPLVLRIRAVVASSSRAY